ncbi:fumarylacetoacetase [Ferrovibrio sp.]|uniref:fumarylacetoacetase n=1 Tax=Ferrovibrio sp. TaxID=1917215 RepID=UPI00311E7716
MSSRLDDTHDPSLKSWVASANTPTAEFPIQNLPHGVFRERGGRGVWRGGVAIGDRVLDLAAIPPDIFEAPTVTVALRAASASTLNGYLALGRRYWSALRQALSLGLREGSKHQAVLTKALLGQHDVEMRLPTAVGDYTDFYTSIHHATNVGKLFRPDNPLLPNYRWVPIGYHGRSSSLAVSGESIRRPQGQTLAPGAEAPTVGPSKRIDHELELGLFIGPGNERGAPVSIENADDQMFGLCLLNDWSARDLQAWEYQPLGPFLAKSFATTISPWIVTMDALEPFRAPFERDAGEPQPLPYLDSPENRERGAIDLKLEVYLLTKSMRDQGKDPARISTANFAKSAYWTLAQLVTHHTVNGCNLQPGDLLGTGTQSGSAPGEEGSLLELTRGGKEPIELPGGEKRIFLEDGDTIIFKGWCERPGVARIGFGEVAATILPA